MQKHSLNTVIIGLLFLLMTTICQSFEKPSAYAPLSQSAFQKIDTTGFNKKNNSIVLPLSHKKSALFTILRRYKHSNGDTSIQGQLADNKGHISATIGNGSIFGQMHIGKTHYILTTEGTGSFVIELPQSGLNFNGCGFDHTNNNDSKIATISNQNETSKADKTVIDFLVLYSQGIVDRYPGDLLETRLNQYFNISNQVFANSNVNLSIRLVATKQTSYEPFNSNLEARNHLQLSLSGVNISGLETVKQDRELYGADMVVLIRPHNMDTRGNCGIAFFPTTNTDGLGYNPSYGVHIMSDGMSSWSICTDQLLVHELGHNLGAGHHNVTAPQRFMPAAAGFAKLGQFTTVMGSFGTGQAERFLEINVFSNPNILCGGVACGSQVDFNNVNVINQMKDIVANYQPSISTLPIPEFNKVNSDQDSDGVSDWEDPFPFDPTETNDSDNDGVGDNVDVFPSNASEAYDFDNDGLGNNEDNDDDNDGIEDFLDLFPFNPSETEDTDFDGVGDNSDLFPNNNAEQQDFDLDGIGDNLDNDDDNDTYIDLDSSAQDLLVINTGNNQILRIDAQTGDSHGIEILSTEGLLTYQSDLTYRQESQILLYTSSSSIKRLNLMTREALGLFIPPYDHLEGANIGTGFPTSLSSINNGKSLAITRLNNPRVLITKGQEKAFFDYSYDWGLAFGARPIDIVSLEENSYILDKTGFLYVSSSPSTIELIETTRGLFQNWFDKPFALAINANNTLYVTNQNSNSVGTVNMDDGSVTEVFIDLENHGYSNPTGIVVTNNNILLVAAHDQNAVLKFNAETGEYLGVLLKSNGLDNPHKMILVPKLNDRFHHDATKVIKPNAGLWYNPETNGRGFDIQVFNNRLSVIWYTFDDEGLPTWYISSGDLNGFEYTGNFDKTHLNPDGSFSLENVGTISIEFSDERNAQINWQINNVQGSEAIQWLVWSYAEEIENYTGLWGRPDGPGWGVSIATIGQTSIAIPYIYDSAGEPRWIISNPVTTSSPLSFDFNAIFSDTLCPSCTGKSAFTTSPAGTMVLDLTTNKTWNSNIQFPTPVSGEWLLNNTEIKLFSSEATRPR